MKEGDHKITLSEKEYTTDSLKDVGFSMGNVSCEEATNSKILLRLVNYLTDELNGVYLKD